MTIGLTLTGILIANIVVTMALNLTFLLFDICFYAYNPILKNKNNQRNPYIEISIKVAK